MREISPAHNGEIAVGGYLRNIYFGVGVGMGIESEERYGDWIYRAAMDFLKRPAFVKGLGTDSLGTLGKFKSPECAASDERQITDCFQFLRKCDIGKRQTVYKCESVTVNASASSAVATFATIKKSGEYLLTVPDGAFSGYTSDGRLSNDGFNILYTIPRPTGTDDLLNVTFENEETIVESIQHITFSFPDAAEGLKYPFASGITSDITLTYTPSANLNANEEVYHPIGAQLANGNTVTLTFGEALTATGTYKLTIPAGVFEEENNPNSTNALIERTYSIDIRNGVDSIISGTTSTFTVISLQGVTLLSDASAEEVADLPGGIYIINGHKVIIK